ncbi:homeodomain-like protein [Tanacetum coccineum]
MDELIVDVHKINTNGEMKSLHEEIKSIRTSEIDYDKSSPKSNVQPTNLKDTFEHYLKESYKRQDVLNEIDEEIHDKKKTQDASFALTLIAAPRKANAYGRFGGKHQYYAFSLFKRLGHGNSKPIHMVIEMADRSMQSPKGIIKNVLVKINKFIFPIDFIILDIIEDDKVPIILGRPMLATAHARIDVFGKNIFLEVGTEQITFDINERESPAGPARLNDDSSRMFCNPNSNTSVSIDDFVEMDDIWDNMDFRDLTNKATESQLNLSF